MARLHRCHRDLAECITRGRSVPFRRFVAHRWRCRDSAISEASHTPCDAAPRNASDHHLRGMRRAPSSRTTCERAGSHLDRVPQLRASAASGARRSDIADYGSCSPAFTDSVRVGGRRRLPRSLSDVAPSGAPSPAARGAGRKDPDRRWYSWRDLSYARCHGDHLRADAHQGPRSR
jgi:hypothetical protein